MMISWKQIGQVETIAKLLEKIDKPFDLNRRAINMLPAAKAEIKRQLADTKTVRFHHMLINLEAKEFTGCIKVVSPQNKSRSAIMLYKGRVVGCLYGRKNSIMQYMERDAHKMALMDLASPGNLLDEFELPEAMALAAVALFHGNIIEINEQDSNEAQLAHAVSEINNSQLSGCIVVSTAQNETKFMVYYGNGNIIGCHSAASGWLEPSIAPVIEHLKANKDSTVSAAIISEKDITENDLSAIGFSLTGLADERKWLVPQITAIDALTYASDFSFSHNPYTIAQTTNRYDAIVERFYSARKSSFSVAP